jgi:hypothetical protein
MKREYGSKPSGLETWGLIGGRRRCPLVPKAKKMYMEGWRTNEEAAGLR